MDCVGSRLHLAFCLWQLGCPRSGKDTDKRNLTLVDDTCTEITLTLWGDLAKQDEMRWMGNPVVAFKGVKVSSYFLCRGARDRKEEFCLIRKKFQLLDGDTLHHTKNLGKEKE